MLADLENTAFKYPGPGKEKLIVSLKALSVVYLNV